MPRNNIDVRVDTITELVSRNFRTFGGSRDAKNEPAPNPIAIALQGQPPCFAAGVDVRDVVKFVLTANNNL